MKSLTAFGFTALLLVGSARSAILIQDNFSRTGSLGGSTASPTGGVWTSGLSPYSLDGTQVVVPVSGSGGYFHQPVSLMTNSVYSLFVTITNNTSLASQDWLGYGFGAFGVGSGASIILKGNGEATAVKTSGNDASSGAISDTFEIRLNTGATLDSSSVSFFRNVGGSPVAIGPSVSTDASTYNLVFIQDSGNSNGYYDNFILTGTAVPEASSALLGILGAVSLMSRRRS